jgi:hypothetical protein
MSTSTLNAHSSIIRLAIVFLFTVATIVVRAQDDGLPYHIVPSSPENYSSGALASRMVDGLGFRFYWATEGLRAEDIAFKPVKDARTSRETIEHIYDLSVIIVNATTGTVNSEQTLDLSFEDLRRKTLQNLKAASDRLRTASDNDVKKFKAKFKSGDKIVDQPFWNIVNGPIEDCVWHVGQIVTLRRSSGNPINDKVNFFTGTVNP